ncbi:MAG: hypothetical protein QOJ50_761, partial [Cryptosporangiaceae bacterium]|nr:hypothetical protein [Cryptosporangiaceae bacterium]
MALGDPGPFDEQLTGRYLPEAELLADAAVAHGDLDRLARLAGTVPDRWSRAVALTAAVAGSDQETAAGLLPIAVLAADELGAAEHRDRATAHRIHAECETTGPG